MRLQKYIIISCIIILILSVIGIFITEQDNKFYDLSTGVFTGVVLTGMTSIILRRFILHSVLLIKIWVIFL